ncbi:MAG: tetratricopeptide repeat protein [Planctomycetes bacterium]|nr:tetratricopeptide repeat protein [Planctomycetota bacterium]
MTLLLSLSTASLARWACPLMVALAALLAVAPLHADLADELLDGLRERGWHDTALEYLDAATQDPLATSAFREKIDYERATTQAVLARQAASDKKRQALLAEAAASFQRFAAEKPNSPLQLQALATAGNLFTEQALFAINQAAKLPEAARRQREQLHETARSFLDQAKKPLQTLLTQCKAKLKSLPKAAARQKNPRAGASRQQLEGKQAEARFLLAKLDFEKARTFAPDSKAQQKSLKSATAAFAKLYKDYEDKLVGFYGRFYQGRSYQAAGDFEEALKCYWDIVDQPPIPNKDFRRLVARAYRYRAECHLAGEDHKKAIKECREWLDESRGSELSEPDWLAVAYQLATAYEAQAAITEGREAQRLRNEARKLYREIARSPGEFQRDAKAKMAASRPGGEKPVVAKTFDEAFDAGKDAFEQMNSAKLAARLAKENNPSAVESLTEQAEANQVAATQYFLQASQLADEQTDPDQLVTARYYLSWLYLQSGRLNDAAVISEFLARRYPENKVAPGAAKFALAAYERLYNAAKQAGEATDFEAQRLAEVAELLVTRWPESSEAASALNLLINLALRDNRLSEAEEMLERLPASSRAAAELRLGGAIWNRYLRDRLKASDKSQAGSEEAALALKKKAGKLLARGFETLKGKPQATAVEANGVLYFVQFLLADGAAERAIAALENPSVGPLSLIENNSPAAQQAVFVRETYKVALRAYVSVEPPQRDKAQAMMTALESAIGDGGGKAQQKLISIYVSLGRQLQQQISALTADGQTDKARAVAEAFADLLARVTERAGAADNWTIQSWIAQTNLQLGQGLRGKDATRYYQQAEAAYRTLLKKAAEDPKFAPKPIAVLATKKRLADCLQAQEKYTEAFEQYTSILQAKPNMLELQLAAATALQQWGSKDEDVERLEESIRGAMPQTNKKNLVWGWLRLASIADQAKRKAEKRAAGKPDASGKVAKYRDLFFEARYRVAQARFATAQLATGDTRKKQLRKARQSLESMKRLYPGLGGPRWKEAYLQLLKQMEQEQ